MEGNRAHKQQVLHPDIGKFSANGHIDRCVSDMPFPYKIIPFS